MAKAVQKKKPVKKKHPPKPKPKPICRVPEFIPFGGARAKIAFDFQGQMLVSLVSGMTEVWPLNQDQVAELRLILSRVLAWHKEAQN